MTTMVKLLAWQLTWTPVLRFSGATSSFCPFLLFLVFAFSESVRVVRNIPSEESTGTISDSYVTLPFSMQGPVFAGSSLGTSSEFCLSECVVPVLMIIQFSSLQLEPRSKSQHLLH